MKSPQDNDQTTQDTTYNEVLYNKILIYGFSLINEYL